MILTYPKEPPFVVQRVTKSFPSSERKYNYIKSILPNEPVVVNNRAVISPLELDIYIPSKKYHDLKLMEFIMAQEKYLEQKIHTYHLNKTKLCAAKSIRLLHVL